MIDLTSDFENYHLVLKYQVFNTKILLKYVNSIFLRAFNQYIIVW